MTRDDFEVFEDGVLQGITFFSYPRSVAISSASLDPAAAPEDVKDAFLKVAVYDAAEDHVGSVGAALP